MTVRYRDQARDDVDAIARYIADANPAAAGRLLQALDRTTDLLARFPGAGTSLPGRSRRTQKLRRITVDHFDNYVIYYFANDVIEIVRVLHSARDRDAILKAEF